MIRACLLAVVVLAALPPAAAARTYQVDVPAALKAQLEEAREAGTVPILLPSRLPSERRRLYGAGEGDERSYAFTLAAVPDCGGANACTVASFTAERGGRPSYRRRVRLIGGRTGYYKPLTCGASCSPPELQWVRGGVLYAIAAEVGTKRTERRLMVGLANAALLAGPR